MSHINVREPEVFKWRLLVKILEHGDAFLAIGVN